MNIRIQTYGKPFQLPWIHHGQTWDYSYDESWLINPRKDNTTVFEALEKGLDDLMEACDVVTEKFTEARDNFEADHMKS